MPWRALVRPRILQRADIFQRYAYQLDRHNSTTRPEPTRSERNESTESLAPSSKKVILARHADLLATAGTEDDVTGIDLKIAGLVRSVRKQKKVAFAHISDGSTLQPVQAILTPDLAQDITNGSYVEVTGTWSSSPAQGQMNELQVKEVNCIGQTNPDDFPIQKKSMSADFLRTVPHLRFRTPFHALVARARSCLVKSVNHYYSYVRLNEAFQVQPPLITSSDCEGAGEVFTIAPKSSTSSFNTSAASGHGQSHFYFRDPKYLTVSSQLHLEAYSAELGDVWTLSPTFRAEESDTPRHLSEFYMLEAEFRSMTSLSKLMKEVENLVRYLTSSFQTDTVGRQLLAYYADPKHQSLDPDQAKANLEERWHLVSGCPWTVITYTDAISALEQHHAKGHQFTFPPSWQTGLQLEHERWLVENIGRNSPVFVTHYPRHIKPFYMLPSTTTLGSTSQQSPSVSAIPEDTDIDTVACFDLLFPYGTAEVTGGSLREHRLPNLIDAMRDKGLIKQSPPPPSSSPESAAIATAAYPHLRPGESLGSLQWYADLRRYGSSPHGGFGLGFDRLLAYLTGTANVRDTVGFPRWYGRADC